MRVRVEFDSLKRLERDMEATPAALARGGAKAVDQSRRFAERTMKEIARASVGPHGKAYPNRIDSEMIGAMEAEIGPRGVVDNNAVGAGWRRGVNTDIPRTADLAGPYLAKRVNEVIDGLPLFQGRP